MSNTAVEPQPSLRPNHRRKLPKGVKRALVFALVFFLSTNLLTLLMWVSSSNSAAVPVLLTASRVEVFALQSKAEEEEKNGWGTFKPARDRILYCNIVGRGDTQGFWFARCLSASVLQPWPLIQPEKTRCMMLPAVCFRAWGGRKCVDVIVCFHCGQMVLVSHDGQGRESQSNVFQIYGLQSFQLFALAHQALPDDPRFNLGK